MNSFVFWSSGMASSGVNVNTWEVIRERIE